MSDVSSLKDILFAVSRIDDKIFSYQLFIDDLNKEIDKIESKQNILLSQLKALDERKAFIKNDISQLNITKVSLLNGIISNFSDIHIDSKKDFAKQILSILKEHTLLSLLEDESDDKTEVVSEDIPNEK